MLIAYAIIAATSTTVFAAPITQPGDLAPGDSYRLVFVTSTTRDATSSDIGDYNSFVAGVAAGESGLAALGTTWKAIGSTTSVHAHDNTDSNPAVDGTGVPIYRLDGTRIANNYVDLWDSSLIAPVATFEDGMATAMFSNRVWTGTVSSGFVNPSFPLGATEDVIYGNPLSAFSGWTTTSIVEDPSVPYHMYAMSGVITVVPEPSTSVLAGIAGLIAFAVRFRRRP